VNLSDPETLKAFLSRHGLSASKGLGQHFLVSRKAVDAIVGACQTCSGILEIGPGPGVLTSPLSEQATKVIALELDDRMIGALGESAPKADVRNVDALKADLAAILDELPAPTAIVSNLPYYITGSLLQAIAQQRERIEAAVLMMQKEVGVRIMAKEKASERGSLSVFLQAQFEISTIIQVPAGAFLPPPKVDSIVLKFVPRSKVPPSPFFRIVRLGFAQQRKTLANNLANGLHIPREQALRAILASGLGEKARPQELTLEEWESLSETLGEEFSGSNNAIR
jgi:16S rRNA (adenine1518-N6/adenine1519-N6)-dimethyltransferase